MRPRAIIWRRCPASAALKEILAALLSSLTPDTTAKALASRFNRAPPVAARHAIHLDDALRTNVLALDLACKMEHSCSRIKVIMA